MSTKEDRDRRLAEMEVARIAIQAAEAQPKPLKKARSEAEITRVRQGYALIFLGCINTTLTILILLKTFGIL